MADHPEGSSLAGTLLVAAPTLGDPNFARTVVLVLDHGEDGALGVVLNRPSDTAVGEVLPGWETLSADPPVVFVGGPVQPEMAVCLGQKADDVAADPPGAQPLLDWVTGLDVSGDPEVAAAGIERIRIYAGYAGWAPGQVEAEVASGDWYPIEAMPADAFSDQPASLWRQVLRRQRGLLRIVAEFPLHPALN